MGYPASLTDEEVAHIKERFEHGHSADLIASDMGLTKGQVSGKIARMKLVRKPDAVMTGLTRKSRPLSDFHEGVAPAWLTAEADRLFVRLWTGEISLHTIAALFNVDRHAVQRRRSVLGLEPRGASGFVIVSGDGMRWRSEKADAELRAMWDAGASAVEIMERFNVARATLTVRCKELKLSRRGTGGGPMHAQTSPKAPKEPKAEKIISPPKIKEPSVRNFSLTRGTASPKGGGGHSLNGISGWSFATLPKPVSVVAGRCRWPLTCVEPGEPFCEMHRGLIGKKRAA